MYICVCTCIHIYVYLCIYIYIYIYTYLRIYMYIYVYMHIYIYIYFCKCIHICVCFYVYISRIYINAYPNFTMPLTSFEWDIATRSLALEIVWIRESITGTPMRRTPSVGPGERAMSPERGRGMSPDARLQYSSGGGGGDRGRGAPVAVSPGRATSPRR